MRTVVLLCCSNVFMTFAWYGHLKTLQARPLYIAILVSWGIAFFEYVLMVPANRTTIYGRVCAWWGPPISCSGRYSRLRRLGGGLRSWLAVR